MSEESDVSRPDDEVSPDNSLSCSSGRVVEGEGENQQLSSCSPPLSFADDLEAIGARGLDRFVAEATMSAEGVHDQRLRLMSDCCDAKRNVLSYESHSGVLNIFCGACGVEFARLALENVEGVIQ